MLYIYNTLTRQKEALQSKIPGQVSIYVCGMTVYDYCHLGHARMLVGFDLIVRYLRYRGYKVYYVRNITDVDDKILKRAQENHENWQELAERFIAAMHEDEKRLKVLPPDIEPRATTHIKDMIAMIEILINKGYAYVAVSGDVYYSVAKFEGYGKLTQQDVAQLKKGARIDIFEDKKDPLDFALWKSAAEDEAGWDSPWGKGRPGWHIECSAMSTKYLGPNFDIHGGGRDLQFPHHENEIAQSEATYDGNFANIWMHVGHLQINQEKMSKSLGNFFTIRELLTKYPAEVLRYLLIASHYRSPINYSLENLESAHAALARFYLALRDLPQVEEKNTENFELQLQAKMDDDFNTPEALAVLFDMVREINRYKDEAQVTQAAELAAGLKRLGNMLGILQEDPEQFLCQHLDNDTKRKVTILITERDLARSNRNWHEADRIRDELLKMGVIIEDTAQGTTWRTSDSKGYYE